MELNRISDEEIIRIKNEISKEGVAEGKLKKDFQDRFIEKLDKVASSPDFQEEIRKKVLIYKSSEEIEENLKKSTYEYNPKAMEIANDKFNPIKERLRRLEIEIIEKSKKAWIKKIIFGLGITIVWGAILVLCRHTITNGLLATIASIGDSIVCLGAYEVFKLKNEKELNELTLEYINLKKKDEEQDKTKKQKELVQKSARKVKKLSLGEKKALKEFIHNPGFKKIVEDVIKIYENNDSDFIDQIEAVFTDVDAETNEKVDQIIAELNGELPVKILTNLGDDRDKKTVFGMTYEEISELYENSNGFQDDETLDVALQEFCTESQSSRKRYRIKGRKIGKE